MAASEPCFKKDKASFNCYLKEVFMEPGGVVCEWSHYVLYVIELFNLW